MTFSPSRETPLSSVFAAFSSSLALSSVPGDVIENAKLLFLDALGTGLASANSPFGDTLLGSFDDTGARPVAVLGRAESLSVRDAAVATGALIHTLDFDDTHIPSMVHVSAVIAPVVYSLAQARKSSGTEALLAFIAGIEALGRIGMAAPGRFHAKGFHATAVCGPLAASLAASRLLRLDEEQTRTAQGLAVSYSAGVNEWLEDGAWNKRLHPGNAAAAGIASANYAAKGFIGVQYPYEGRHGLYSTHLDSTSKVEWASLRREIGGSEWEIRNVAVKPYPLCHATHAFVDLGIAVRDDGIAADEIVAVTGLVHERQVNLVLEPLDKKRRPRSAYEAQFSIPFAFAAAFLRGRFGVAELEPDCWNDPQVQDLAAKVGYGIDPQSAFPKAYSGEVVVELKNGETRRYREAVNRGADTRPLSRDEIVLKFKDNARLWRQDADTQAIVDSVLTIESLADLDALVARTTLSS